LKSLYETHLKHPDYVIGHRLRTIQFDENGNALPYDSWKYNQKAPLKNQMTIGVNGVLYPPKIFSEAIHDERLFMKLAPKNDDLWFKAIELVEGIKIRKSDQTPPPPFPIAETQKISLDKENVDQKMNDSQWSELTEYYNLNKYLKL